MPYKIQLSLIHPKDEMCMAFKKHFASLPNVNIVKGLFERLPPHDCFVTAGNSYGIMNAGIDAAVIKFHGIELMQKVQYQIQADFLGEQPIGTSIIIETQKENYPFVAHTPTMRVPGSIVGTDKVYQSTFAALTAIYRHNINSETRINSVVIPALGAGWGCVKYEEVARQMAVAYKNYLYPPHNMNWEMAAARQKEICYNGNERVIT